MDHLEKALFCRGDKVRIVDDHSTVGIENIHHLTIEGKLTAYFYLSIAQAHDAHSYYHDHIEEIEAYSQTNGEEDLQSKDLPRISRQKLNSWYRSNPTWIKTFLAQFIA